MIKEKEQIDVNIIDINKCIDKLNNVLALIL